MVNESSFNLIDFANFENNTFNIVTELLSKRYKNGNQRLTE